MYCIKKTLQFYAITFLCFIFIFTQHILKNSDLTFKTDFFFFLKYVILCDYSKTNLKN